MRNEKSRKIKVFFSAIIAILIILLLFFIIKNYNFYNKSDSTSVLTETKEAFPLKSSEGSQNLSNFVCVITRNIVTDFEYSLSSLDSEKIQIKLLTECEYSDLNANKQKLLIITGALFTDKEGIKLSYGGNVYNPVITDPENANGNLIIEEIQRRQKNVNNLETEPSFEAGQELKLILSLRDNYLIEDSIVNTNNTLISRYTYNYLIKYWDDQVLFWQTGNPNYLPDSKEGKILPVLGIYWK